MTPRQTGRLRAGTARHIITPKPDSELSGYGNRPDAASGIHDDLHVRVLVLDDSSTTIALCSVEILWLWRPMVQEIRTLVSQRVDIPSENIILACTHTHSGPASENPDNWGTPLAELIAEAIVAACEARQPARIGFGFGQLFGYNINRRWLNRPTDPSVGVMRVETESGQPLAVVTNYACHAVVMGYDNNLVSGDWPGYSSRHLEAELPGFTALFMQGGAGDVNPLTETVRQRLAAGHPVGAIGDVSGCYGGDQTSAPGYWNIGDRGGGTFVECETLARAVNTEVLKVWRAIPTSSELSIDVSRVVVNGAADAKEPRLSLEGFLAKYRHLLQPADDGSLPVEVTLVRLGSAVLMTQPGEVFSETAVEFRKRAQQMGYAFPWLVSYSNGSYAYLPPNNAFEEGGYEVELALRVGLSRKLQDRITEAILPILKSHFA
jgi:neutral ceramidase